MATLKVDHVPKNDSNPSLLVPWCFFGEDPDNRGTPDTQNRWDGPGALLIPSPKKCPLREMAQGWPWQSATALRSHQRCLQRRTRCSHSRCPDKPARRSRGTRPDRWYNLVGKCSMSCWGFLRPSTRWKYQVSRYTIVLTLQFGLVLTVLDSSKSQQTLLNLPAVLVYLLYSIPKLFTKEFRLSLK